MKKIIIFTILILLFIKTPIYAKRVYHIDDVDTKELNCWMGWKDWHFGTAGTLNRKGETVKYKRAMIIDGKLN